MTPTIVVAVAIPARLVQTVVAASVCVRPVQSLAVQVAVPAGKQEGRAMGDSKIEPKTLER